MASILKVRDAGGTVHEIHSLQGKSAYQYAQEGGYTGTEEEFAARLAKEMPDKLPNPNALTFTGAVNAKYDGSSEIIVDIPSSGGTWELINFLELESDVLSVSISTDSSGNPFRLKAVELFLMLTTAKTKGEISMCYTKDRISPVYPICSSTTNEDGILYASTLGIKERKMVHIYSASSVNDTNVKQNLNNKDFYRAADIDRNDLSGAEYCEGIWIGSHYQDVLGHGTQISVYGVRC